MMKKILLFIIITILFNKNSITAGDYSISKVSARNFTSEIKSSLADISYNLIDIDNSKYIYHKEIYKKYFQITSSLDYEFYSQRIPEEYLVSFLYFTKDNVHLRELVYSIMKHESMNFQIYSNKNRNGTSDHGPMMLNSRNIKNKNFMKNYKNHKEIIEKMGEDISTEVGRFNYYNAICINMITYLVKKYEREGRSGAAWFALRAYNAGESSNTKYGNISKIRRGTYYANTVWNLYHKTLNDMNNFKLNKGKEL